MAKECCSDWSVGTKEINDFINFKAQQLNDPKIYKGKIFVFCPWCGEPKTAKAKASLADEVVADLVKRVGELEAITIPKPVTSPVVAEAALNQVPVSPLVPTSVMSTPKPQPATK